MKYRFGPEGNLIAEQQIESETSEAMAQHRVTRSQVTQEADWEPDQRDAEEDQPDVEGDQEGPWAPEEPSLTRVA